MPVIVLLSLSIIRANFVNQIEVGLPEAQWSVSLCGQRKPYAIRLKNGDGRPDIPLVTVSVDRCVTDGYYGTTLRCALSGGHLVIGP
jgi:hypothetical protein